MQQNLGVRTAEVTQRRARADASRRSAASPTTSATWRVVQARANGFVERLHVRAPLDPVRKGQPLAELYVPDWVAAQEEYLSRAPHGGHATSKRWSTAHGSACASPA